MWLLWHTRNGRHLITFDTLCDAIKAGKRLIEYGFTIEIEPGFKD